MSSQNAKIIMAGSMIGLLLSSFLAIVGGMNNAQAQETNSSEIGAASGSNRFVVWSDNTPGKYDIFLRRSVDNGASWQATKNLSNNAGDSFFPEIAVSGSNVYVVWQQRDSDGTLTDILFRRSTDNGATWKSKVNLSNVGQVGNSTPEIAVLGAYVHVVWEQEDPTSGFGTSQLFIRSSENSGSTWNTAKRLTSENEDFGASAVVAWGSNVYVAFERDIFVGSPDSAADLLFLAGRDNGATWEPVVTLAEDVMTNRENGPWLLAINSNVYVFWSNADFTNGQLYFRRSTDSGATFGPISPNLNNKDRIPREGVQVALSGSNLYLVWANIWPHEVYFLRSIDSGATWDSVKNISNNPRRSLMPQFAL